MKKLCKSYIAKHCPRKQGLRLLWYVVPMIVTFQLQNTVHENKDCDPKSFKVSCPNSIAKHCPLKQGLRLTNNKFK